MKQSKTMSLVERFKKLEDKLVEVLKIEPLNFDAEKSAVEVKKEIKNYIKKVKIAKVVFDEYEQLAKEIEGVIEKSESDMADEVVGLREEYVDQVEVVQDAVKVVKKKKNNSATKEF